jgi:hypothetical protein
MPGWCPWRLFGGGSVGRHPTGRTGYTLDHEATLAKREQVDVDSLRQTFFAVYWNLLNSMKESAR